MMSFKTTMIAGAAMGLLFAGSALAQNVQGRPGTAPGQINRTTPPPGHTPGHGSTTAPGQLMQQNSGPTASPGASSFAPGRAQGNPTPGNPATTGTGGAARR